MYPGGDWDCIFAGLVFLPVCLGIAVFDAGFSVVSKGKKEFAFKKEAEIRGKPV